MIFYVKNLKIIIILIIIVMEHAVYDGQILEMNKMKLFNFLL